MKKKMVSTIIKWCCLTLLIGMIGLGCRKQDYFYKEFLEGGEIVYAGKADSVRFYPGDHRAKLSWIITDPNINKMKVYWNNRLDSMLIDVNNGSGIDSIDVMISGLEERLYVFDIYSVDEAGNTSISVVQEGQVYGEDYAASLIDRPIIAHELQHDSVRLQLGAYRAGTFATEILVKNQQGDEQALRVPITDSVTKIAAIGLVDGLKYRTLFLPDTLAIDTFYTEFTTYSFTEDVADSSL